jgi:membrane protein required for colicin V production
MLLDFIFAILVVLAIVKGFQKGLIVAVFSFIAFFIGLAAALKLSAVVAGYLGQNVKISDRWLPVISFIVVFIIVIILVNLGAKAIEKAFQLAMLGWINRLGGIIFYLLLYITVFSVLLFYAKQLNLLKPETVHNSVTYAYIEPWGPKAINAFGKLIPVFKDMFIQLEEFFSNISKQVPKT